MLDRLGQQVVHPSCVLGQDLQVAQVRLPHSHALAVRTVWLYYDYSPTPWPAQTSTLLLRESYETLVHL